MFTGIIEATAEVLEHKGKKLRLRRPKIFDDLAVGSSIAVSGVCLTVTAFDSKSMTFEVIEQTRKKSKLSSLHTGDSVNLERAMRVGDRFGGHIVLGHCEGVGTVKKTGALLTVSVPAELKKLVLRQGSIAIDGVALTVAGLLKDGAAVALIPHTRKATTLGKLKPGDKVNLETDVLGRYILESIHGGA
jgi:riboflavin synthase